MGDIAIIGYSGRFPGADTINEFWTNLCDGKESITFFSSEELLHHGVSHELLHSPNYVKASPILGKIDLFDAEFFNYAPKEADILDPQQRLLLECAWKTLEHAGYATNTKAQNIGFYMGSGGVVTSYLLEYLQVNPFIKGMTGSFEHLANDKDFVPTRISYKLDLTGPSMAIQTACSTSLLTVHQACQSLSLGECEMALAGGINIRIPHISGYLRQRGDVYSEDGHIRTFDAKATGIVFGSGIGLVMLKPLENAIRDGDTVYAVIKGSAVNNDGLEKLSYTASSYKGQVECISKALARTQISPETIQYIETHGTGTVMGDPIEVAALTDVFKQYNTHEQSCGLGSVKSNVGHLDTAAGVVSLIKAIMIINNRQLPPQINLEELNPKIDFSNSPFYINTELKQLDAGDVPLRIGVNSLGIGGTNVFMVLEEPPELEKAKQQSDTPLLLNISARNKKSLETLVTQYKAVFNQADDADVDDICYTSNTGRGQFEQRISLMANTSEVLKNKVNQLSLSDTSQFSEFNIGYELNVAFYMGNPSEKACELLQTMRKRIKMFDEKYTTCLL